MEQVCYCISIAEIIEEQQILYKTNAVHKCTNGRICHFWRATLKIA